MASATAVSRAEPGTADPVRAASVVSTGTVEIHPEHAFGTRKPLYWWLLTSRDWPPPRPISAYVIEHANALVLFNTGQDRTSVTDPSYLPGGVTGHIYDCLARFHIGERSPLQLVGDLTYGTELLVRGQLPGVGTHKQLVETTAKVLALKETMPDLVILPAHDPTAARRLLES
jgi:hypothetical protein